MAKLSVVHRGLKRDKTVKKFCKKRADIKDQLQKAFANGDEGTFDLQLALQKLPRNSAAVRTEKRCQTCGRPHAVYRKFGLCRLCLRKFAMQGFVPGLEKASW